MAQPQQNRPASNSSVPDPADTYERAHPAHEAGQGRLDNNVSTPVNRPDHVAKPVANAQDGAVQINSLEAPPKPDPSIAAEPLGWEKPSQKTGG